jgi:hypothetical protein
MHASGAVGGCPPASAQAAKSVAVLRGGPHNAACDSRVHAAAHLYAACVPSRLIRMYVTKSSRPHVRDFVVLKKSYVASLRTADTARSRARKNKLACILKYKHLLKKVQTCKSS